MKAFSHSIKVVGDRPIAEWCSHTHLETTVGVQVRFRVEPHIEYSICHAEHSRRRVDAIIHYLNHLLPFTAFDSDISFYFQGADAPIDYRSVSWQKLVNSDRIMLVPDFYYVSEDGYRSFLSDKVTPWHERQTKAIWRGANTGSLCQTIDTFLSLPRLKLCQIGSSDLGGLADFFFTNVVQENSVEDKLAIEDYLHAHSLMRERIRLEDYARCKMLVQIDGNGNSWELMKKLRTGCCMLLVGSKWELWHNKPLRAWQHYVPVAEDLHDLVEKVEWCVRHDQDARHIASQGRRLACSLDFEAEMAAAANSLWCAFRA